MIYKPPIIPPIIKRVKSQLKNPPPEEDSFEEVLLLLVYEKSVAG